MILKIHNVKRIRGHVTTLGSLSTVLITTQFILRFVLSQVLVALRRGLNFWRLLSKGKMENISVADGFSNKSFSSTEELPSKAAGIAWCSAFVLEAVLIVAANLLTIVLFATNKKLRKKCLYPIINLAFADLLLGVYNVPVHILFFGGDDELWIVPSWIDSLGLAVQTTEIIILQATMISAAFITGERFYAIYWPFKHLTLSVKAYCVAICVVWISSILGSMIWLFILLSVSEEPAFSFLASFFVTLLFFVFGCNFGIWRKLQHGGIASQQQNRTAQNKRLTKTLLFVSFVVFLSWLPFLIVQYLDNFIADHSPLTSFIAGPAILLSFSNSFLNTLVYAWRIPEFKQALRMNCFTRQAVMSKIEDGKSDNERGASVLPMTQLKTSSSDPSNLKAA